MAIDPASLVWYQSATWNDTTNNGGDRGTTVITSGVSQNVFSNITDAERVSGVTKYRKVFFRNENADNYDNIHGWITANTPATNSDVSILAAGNKSLQGADSAALTGTFTFAASTTVLATSNISKECRPGEKIFNSTDDTNTSAVAIDSISADGLTITLAGAYGGTAGATKGAKLAPISGCTFVQPITEGTGIVLANLASNTTIAIWIKDVISAGGLGYTDDTFTIRVSDS
jgi:hypothetical protein